MGVVNLETLVIKGKTEGPLSAELRVPGLGMKISGFPGRSLMGISPRGGGAGSTWEWKSPMVLGVVPRWDWNIME